MRFGLIIYGKLEILTGGYIYDRCLVEALLRNGHSVEIISLAQASYGRSTLDNFSKDLFRRIIRSRFDALLEDELCHPSLFLLNGRLKRGGGPPIVSIVHHTRSSEPQRKWQAPFFALLERLYFSSVDACIFNSETTREKVRRLAGKDPPHVVAPPAGDRLGTRLSVSKIRERSSRAGPLRLLYLGAVIARKGLYRTVKALRGVARKKWVLNVAGNPDVEKPYVRRLRASLKAWGLVRQVRFLGVLQESELSALLAESHLLYMPHAYEGFGIVYLEGMAYGLPAVGSLAGGAREIIRDGLNGFLTARGDVVKPRSIIEKLFSDREHLFEMSRAALGSFEMHPTWDESMQRVEGFLRDVAP